MPCIFLLVICNIFTSGVVADLAYILLVSTGEAAKFIEINLSNTFNWYQFYDICLVYLACIQRQNGISVTVDVAQWQTQRKRPSSHHLRDPSPILTIEWIPNQQMPENWNDTLYLVRAPWVKAALQQQQKQQTERLHNSLLTDVWGRNKERDSVLSRTQLKWRHIYETQWK